MKVQNRGELQDVITRNAAGDAEYRDALIKNPKGLLERHLQRELPDWLKVQVVEETANTVYLIAPHVAGTELSDDDLEAVAGGKGSSESGGVTIEGDVDCSDALGSFNSVINISGSVNTSFN